YVNVPPSRVLPCTTGAISGRPPPLLAPWIFPDFSTLAWPPPVLLVPPQPSSAAPARPSAPTPIPSSAVRRVIVRSVADMRYPFPFRSSERSRSYYAAPQP